jgi:hypothetical protein
MINRATKLLIRHFVSIETIGGCSVSSYNKSFPESDQKTISITSIKLSGALRFQATYDGWIAQSAKESFAV